MQDGEVLYEIPVRNVSERKGQKKTLPPRSGGRDCKSRPAKNGNGESPYAGRGLQPRPPLRGGNVSERKGQKKTLPPRSGGRDCKSRPAKDRR
jgi:hypothetical protein